MPATLASLRGWVCRVWCRPLLTLYTKTAGVFGSGMGMLGLLPTEEPPWPPDPTLRSGGVEGVRYFTYYLFANEHTMSTSSDQIGFDHVAGLIDWRGSSAAH